MCGEKTGLFPNAVDGCCDKDKVFSIMSSQAAEVLRLLCQVWKVIYYMLILQSKRMTGIGPPEYMKQ